jgi:hypothetical protein
VNTDAREKYEPDCEVRAEVRAEALMANLAWHLDDALVGMRGRSAVTVSEAVDVLLELRSVVLHVVWGECVMQTPGSAGVRWRF